MLFSKQLVLALAPFLVPTFGSPILHERADGPGHPYTCASKYNVAAVKGSLLKAGANSRDLAIAVLETGCDLDAMHYPYGDKKIEDSANFGLFKNNWGTIRRHCSQFKGQGRHQWRNGDYLNTHPVSAIKCQHEQIAALGVHQFYRSQRGIGGQETEDYAKAVEYIQNYLKKGHLHDNQVTYYKLHSV